MSSTSQIAIEITGDSSKAKAAFDKTAVGVDRLRSSLKQFTRLAGMVTAGAAIIATLQKIAQAVRAVSDALAGDADATKLGNLTARVKTLADAYARLTAEITRTAAASARQQSDARAGVQRDLDRDLAVIDLDAARETATDPARAAAIATAAAERRRQARARAGAALESIDTDSITAATTAAERRRQAAAEAQNKALAAQSAAAAISGNRHARLQSETGFSTDDLLSGRFTSRARWGSAEAKKLLGEIQQADALAATAAKDLAKAKEDEAAATAELAALAQERLAIEREGGTRRVREQAERWEIVAQERAAAADRAQAQRAASDRSTGRSAILSRAQAAREAITIYAPGATSAPGSIGGIMGHQGDAAARLQEQRARALEAINREQVTLLAKIDAKLSD